MFVVHKSKHKNDRITLACMMRRNHNGSEVNQSVSQIKLDRQVTEMSETSKDCEGASNKKNYLLKSILLLDFSHV